MTPTQEHLAWFLAGGLTALALARRIARWWRRLFWLVVTAAFALGAVWMLGGGVGAGAPLKTAQRAAAAAARAIFGRPTD
jgi:hypothetical protein